ncbi:hypothetical protein ACH4A8_19210 [Streptomyces vietnamensis]|uniref:hypothetical protein n=1 Tax=Streptomyces vietnamensis TaxID=362257 RepID=UPI00379D1F74
MRGLRGNGPPEFWFTARRWTTEEFDAARHRTDLVPGGTAWVNLDHGRHGIGSASCGRSRRLRTGSRPAPGLSVRAHSRLPPADGDASQVIG